MSSEFGKRNLKLEVGMFELPLKVFLARSAL